MNVKKIEIPIEQLYPTLVYSYITDQAPEKSTYEDRLLWQKVGYLAQQVGASLDDFKFTWYKAGPYSPAYTSILYSLPPIMDNFKKYDLQMSLKEKIAPIKFLYENTPEDLSAAKWFELLASILYIAEDTGLDENAVLKRLIRKKPFFKNMENNTYAWKLLKKLDML